MAQTFTLELTKEEVELVQAALIMYQFAEDAGHALWAIQGGSIGRSDYETLMEAKRIYDRLNQMCPEAESQKGMMWAKIDWLSELVEKDLPSHEGELQKESHATVQSSNNG